MRPSDMEGRIVEKEKPKVGECHVCHVATGLVGHAMDLGAMMGTLTCNIVFTTGEGVTCQLCLLKAANAMVHIMMEEEMKRLRAEEARRDVERN